MPETDTHPFTVFLHETADGNVAYNPATEEEPEQHWVFNWENAGYNFNFLVSDREDVLGMEIRARDIQWVGQFLYNREIEYVEEPCEQVQQLLSECVEIREEPLDIGEMKKYCSGCHLHHRVNVMPKMDLVIDGEPAQRIFKEQCPECGEDMVAKKTYNIKTEGEYPKERGDLEADDLWRYSRRSL